MRWKFRIHSCRRLGTIERSYSVSQFLEQLEYVLRSSQSSAWTIHGRCGWGNGKGPGFNGPCSKCCSEFVISNKLGQTIQSRQCSNIFFQSENLYVRFLVSCCLQLIFAGFKHIRQEINDGINRLHDNLSRQSSKNLGLTNYPVVGKTVKPWQLKKTHVLHIVCMGFNVYFIVFPQLKLGNSLRFSPAPRRISPRIWPAWETRWCHSWWRNNPGKTMEKPTGKTNTPRPPTPNVDLQQARDHLTAKQTFPKQGIQTFHISTYHQKS